MQITFLSHSGFFIELPALCLLFDWWKGQLPPLPAGKPLLVFASHSHEDHFSPAIFALDDGSRDVRFLLGKDIKLSPSRRERWGLHETTAANCLRLGGLEQAQPFHGVVVETLPSTDAGVAFLVTACGQTIFHAGDLNWWHWSGEPDPWNPNMERDFKQFIEPLRGRHIDLAMFPLDPRLERAEGWGLAYYLELTDTTRILPMHQWGDYTGTDRFLGAHPQWADRILPITAEGQHITVEEVEV